MSCELNFKEPSRACHPSYKSLRENGNLKAETRLSSLPHTYSTCTRCPVADDALPVCGHACTRITDTEMYLCAHHPGVRQITVHSNTQTGIRFVP